MEYIVVMVVSMAIFDKPDMFLPLPDRSYPTLAACHEEKRKYLEFNKATDGENVFCFVKKDILSSIK